MSEHLNGLAQGDVWLDLGAGSGNALLDFLPRSAEGVKAVGVAWARPAISPAYAELESRFKAKGTFEFLDGRAVEDIPRSELPQSQLITDFMGPMAYTHDLSRMLRLELSLLKDSKSTLHLAVGTRTTIETSRGNRTPAEWISSLKGLVVTRSHQNGFTVLEIRKLQDEPVIPELSLKHLQPGGMPPVRVFEVTH